MIDDPHTTLIIHQCHMPIVQKANQPGVKHPVPNAQLCNKQQKRSEHTRGKI